MNNITLKEAMELFHLKVRDGAEFLWKCFGNNAFILTFVENNTEASVTFDTINQTVYAVNFIKDVFEEVITDYVYINPEYKEAYIQEASEHYQDEFFVEKYVTLQELLEIIG